MGDETKIGPFFSTRPPVVASRGRSHLQVRVRPRRRGHADVPNVKDTLTDLETGEGSGVRHCRPCTDGVRDE